MYIYIGSATSAYGVLRVSQHKSLQYSAKAAYLIFSVFINSLVDFFRLCGSFYHGLLDDKTTSRVEKSSLSLWIALMAVLQS